MLADQPEQHSADQDTIDNEEVTTGGQLLQPLPSAVQLLNVFPIQIIAQRFPVETANSPIAQLKLTDVQVDPENLRAQALLTVDVGFADEPHPFEIHFQMLGVFTYSKEYNATMVQTFLTYGSPSALLPFAREFLWNLCMRLQLPPIMLAMAQVASPSPSNIMKEENSPH